RAAEPVHIDKWETPVKKDAFKIPIEAKYELLQDVTKRMKETDVVARRGTMSFSIVEKYFGNSEGSKIYQVLSYAGASIIVAAKGPTGVQRRSVQQNMGGGYELIDDLDLTRQAAEITKDAIALTHAPTINEGKSDIILSGDQVALQVHESCGHPIELDRV